MDSIPFCRFSKKRWNIEPIPFSHMKSSPLRIHCGHFYLSPQIIDFLHFFKNPLPYLGKWKMSVFMGEGNGKWGERRIFPSRKEEFGISRFFSPFLTFYLFSQTLPTFLSSRFGGGLDFLPFFSGEILLDLGLSWVFPNSSSRKEIEFALLCLLSTFLWEALI